MELNRPKASLRVDDTDVQEGLCPVRDGYGFPEYRKERGEFYSLAYKTLNDHLSAGPVCGFKLQSSYCLGKLIQVFVLRNRAGKQVVMYNPYDEYILQRIEELKISREALEWTGPQEEKPYVSDVWRENVLSSVQKSAEQLSVKAVEIHAIPLSTRDLRTASFEVMFKEKRIITGADGPFEDARLDRK